MFKRILKWWFLYPIILMIILISVDFAFNRYIDPLYLYEGDSFWLLKSKNFNLNITSKYISGNYKAYVYNIKSIPKDMLDESWCSLTDLLYGAPPGLLYGNLDFDEDKELLVSGCEGGLSKTLIPGLKGNLKNFLYNESYVGYYDFINNHFQFKSIDSSPFRYFIKSNFLDFFPSYYCYLLFFGLLSIILMLLQLFIKGFKKLLKR